jgi:coenzyme F420-dependent glucose-6-phosphate dehydrogenase
MTDTAIEFGYWLSSEEHPPDALVRHALRAEELGFGIAMISDHFHPWLPRQGNSPFVWSVLGAVAHATERLRIGTGVTAPMLRMHPAVVAHAAATVAAMMPGRFVLGLGTGERLNEHVVGCHWPTGTVRREMLEEAIEVIRALWDGGSVTYHGKHVTVETATLYTRPEEPPPIVVAGSTQDTAELAGRIADGYVGTSPEREPVETFEAAGGRGKPKHAQVTLCWAPDEETARRTALHWWANTALKGGVSTDLARPEDFASLAETLRPEDVADAVPCGPDVQRHVDAVAEYVKAGYDHVYLHQIGPDQEGFFRFWQDELGPALGSVTPAVPAGAT